MENNRRINTNTRPPYPPTLKDNGRYLSIDFGVHNFLTCYNSATGETFISGRDYLSTDHYYYKQIIKKRKKWYAQQEAAGIENPVDSKAIQKLFQKRDDYQWNYMHQLLNDIINYCVETDIHTIVAGEIEEGAKKLKYSDPSFQEMFPMPYAEAIEKIRKKCRKHGIRFALQEESWTSQCSPLSPDVSKEYAVKKNRAQRGLYVDGEYTWNADVVGAYNILRKYLKANNIQIELDPYAIQAPYVRELEL